MAVLAVLVAVLAGLGLLVNAVLSARLHGDLRDRLSERAGFAGLLAGSALTDQQLADRLTGQGISATVRDGGTETYGRSRPDPGWPPRGRRPPGTPSPAVIRDDGGTLTATLPVGRRTLILTAGSAEIDRTMSQLRTVELAAGAGTVLVAALLLLRVVGGALAPLDRMTALAGRIARGGRGERLRPSRPDTDLGRTAGAFDEMLDALEESEVRMRRFVADASHDLRTPVAGLLAASESLLRDDPGRTERERRLVAMVREARRAGRLVDDLLLMARLDGAEPARELRREPVDLAVLAEEVAAAQRLLGADVRVVRATAGPVPVVGDPEQLTRVLTNLGDNARRVAGHVWLTVGWRDGHGTVEVTDDGPGVPAADRERVFDRFVRLDGATSGSGHGLGLPIARAVARAHGGELCCEPAGAGARFVLRLPAASADLGHVTVMDARQALTQPRSAGGGGNIG
jgi:signal transduction histidine kinase